MHHKMKKRFVLIWMQREHILLTPVSCNMSVCAAVRVLAHGRRRAEPPPLLGVDATLLSEMAFGELAVPTGSADEKLAAGLTVVAGQVDVSGIVAALSGDRCRCPLFHCHPHLWSVNRRLGNRRA